MVIACYANSTNPVELAVRVRLIRRELDRQSRIGMEQRVGGIVYEAVFTAVASHDAANLSSRIIHDAPAYTTVVSVLNGESQVVITDPFHPLRTLVPSGVGNVLNGAMRSTVILNAQTKLGGSATATTLSGRVYMRVKMAKKRPRACIV